LDPIAMGIFLSSFLGGRVPLLSGRQRCGLVVVGASLWIAAGFAEPDFNQTGVLSLMLAYPAIALGCGTFLLAAIGMGPRPPRMSQWSVYLGRISYGLYVFHGAAITAAAAIVAAPLAPLVSFPLTLAVAHASYQWFEKPFLKLKPRFQYIPSEPVST
jgi:peptidoglycan/LPS O-acetylase OafA/YrhL